MWRVRGPAAYVQPHLCVEERQTPDSVEGDQHLNQELFMFCFQRQSETIDYAGGGETYQRKTNIH